MRDNKEESFVKEEFRQIVKDAARQMGQSLSEAAKNLAVMVKRGEIKIVICTELKAIKILTKLSNEYRASQEMPKSFLWNEEDSLSSLWLCLPCRSELYAPSIKEHCPVCLNKMPISI